MVLVLVVVRRPEVRDGRGSAAVLNEVHATPSTRAVPSYTGGYLFDTRSTLVGPVVFSTV
jgi:hypothetical protein